MNDIPGLVLLPDNWKVTTYQLNSVNDADVGFGANVIGLSDWQHVLEPARVVFLPSAGARTIDGVFMDLGCYHSSSAGAGDAFGVGFGKNGIVIRATGHRGDGLAVRLVQEVE